VVLVAGAAVPAAAADRPAPKPLWDAYPLDTGRVVRSHTPEPRLPPVRPAVRPATLSHDDGVPSPMWWLVVTAGSAALVYLAAHRRPTPARARALLGPPRIRAPRPPRLPRRPERRPRAQHVSAPREEEVSAPREPAAAPPPPGHEVPEVRWVLGGATRTGARFARRYRVGDDPPDQED
jgi:hypothetical protein